MHTHKVSLYVVCMRLLIITMTAVYFSTISRNNNYGETPIKKYGTAFVKYIPFLRTIAVVWLATLIGRRTTPHGIRIPSF